MHSRMRWAVCICVCTDPCVCSHARSPAVRFTCTDARIAAQALPTNDRIRGDIRSLMNTAGGAAGAPVAGPVAWDSILDGRSALKLL